MLVYVKSKFLLILEHRHKFVAHYTPFTTVKLWDIYCVVLALQNLLYVHVHTLMHKYTK